LDSPLTEAKQLDQVYMQGGNLTTAMASTGYVSRIQVNFSGAEEIAIDTSGAGAELATGGVRINILPREGGNTYHGTMFLSFGNDKMQGSNFTQALKDRGLGTPDAVKGATTSIRDSAGRSSKTGCGSTCRAGSTRLPITWPARSST
jgi:hypothetical protein